METIGVTRKRFLILIVYCFFSASNSFQWIQYSIITDIVTEYYGVSVMAVNATSVIYMLVYIPLIFPATWFLDKKGLRLSLIIGSLINFLGAAIKCFSLRPDLFWVAFAGQCLSAVAQIFVLNIPPILSALWFPNSEISRATAVGVFGNLLGVILGFLVPSYLITGGPSYHVTRQMESVVIGNAAITALIFLLILFTVEDKPTIPPSYAQIKGLSRQSSFKTSLKTMFANRDFVLLFICYGMNAGSVYAIGTVLNQIIEIDFPGHNADAGNLGVLSTTAGILGATVGGLLLDKLRWYKRITVVFYAMCTISFAIFGAFLRLKLLWTVYIAATLVGFFATGYLPLGFEFAAEITYPEPEGTSAGLLNVSAQIFGIILTVGGSLLVDKIGSFWSAMTLSAILASGLGLTVITKADLKRQKAESEGLNESPTYSNCEPDSLPNLEP